MRFPDSMIVPVSPPALPPYPSPGLRPCYHSVNPAAIHAQARPISDLRCHLRIAARRVNTLARLRDAH